MNKDFEKIKKELTTAKSKYTSAISSVHSKIEKVETDLAENKAKMNEAVEADDRQAYRKYADLCEYDTKRLDLLREKEQNALSMAFSEADRQRTVSAIMAVLKDNYASVKQRTDQVIKLLLQDAETVSQNVEDASSLLNQLTELTGHLDDAAADALRQVSIFGMNTQTAVENAEKELATIFD